MICVECGRIDKAYNKGFRLESRHPPNTKELFCSICTQIFLAKKEPDIPWTEKKVVNGTKHKRRRR